MTDLRGVTFSAWRGSEIVPVIDLLLVAGRWILYATWRIRDAEFGTGWRASDELNVMSHHALPIPTSTLVDLVSDRVQMIGGDLTAFVEGVSSPYLTIRSVRGDEWDVYSTDESLLAAIREAFDGVTDVPR